MKWKRYKEAIARQSYKWVDINGKRMDYLVLKEVPAIRSEEGFIVVREAQYSSSSKYYSVILETQDSSGYLAESFKSQKGAMHFCESLGNYFINLMKNDMKAARNRLSSLRIETIEDRW